MIEFMRDPGAFLPEVNPQIYILNTDIIEPEIMMRKLAEDTAGQYPDAFSGETPQVFFRIRYTPQYEQFREIKKLILRIRRATGIRSCFRGIITVDVSEYRGHEDEEYFIIFLKYLYDNTKGSKTVFVCNFYSDKEINRLMNSCMRFFPVQYEQINVYEKDRLKILIKSAFYEHMMKTDSDSIELMAEMLCSPELNNHRTLQLIERLPDELVRSTNTRVGERKFDTISEKAVRKYFNDPQSPICMLAGRALLAGKEEPVEHIL